MFFVRELRRVPPQIFSDTGASNVEGHSIRGVLATADAMREVHLNRVRIVSDGGQGHTIGDCPTGTRRLVLAAHRLHCQSLICMSRAAAAAYATDLELWGLCESQHNLPHSAVLGRASACHGSRVARRKRLCIVPSSRAGPSPAVFNVQTTGPLNDIGRFTGLVGRSLEAKRFHWQHSNVKETRTHRSFLWDGGWVHL